MKKIFSFVMIAILAISVLSITGCVSKEVSSVQAPAGTVKVVNTPATGEYNAGPPPAAPEPPFFGETPGVKMRRFHDELAHWEDRVKAGEDIGWGSYGDYMLPAAEALAEWDLLTQEDVNRMGKILDNSESSTCSLETIVEKANLTYPPLAREDEPLHY